MSKYKEILRYHVTGLSQREIQKVTGISSQPSPVY